MLVHYHRGEERAAAVAAEIGGAPIAQADLTVEDDVDRLFATAREELGSVDVCAAVAGVWPAVDLPVWELPLARWEETIRQNLTATFLTAQGVPARGRPHGPRLARARRLDGGPVRRGGARGLRGGEVGAPGRPAAVAEERGGARGAPGAGQRRRSRAGPSRR